MQIGSNEWLQNEMSILQFRIAVSIRETIDIHYPKYIFQLSVDIYITFVLKLFIFLQKSKKLKFT